MATYHFILRMNNSSSLFKFKHLGSFQFLLLLIAQWWILFYISIYPNLVVDLLGQRLGVFLDC